MSDVQGQIIDGRVFIDGADLAGALRADADRQEQRARSLGDPIPPDHHDDAVALHTVAAALRRWADMIDTGCIRHVTAEHLTGPQPDPDLIS